MKLTEREFAERIFWAIDDEDLAAQMAMFVQLYYESTGKPKRWALLKSALECADISLDGLAMVAKASRKYL